MLGLGSAATPFGFFRSDVDRSAFGLNIDTADVFTDYSKAHQHKAADEEDEAEE